MQEKKVLYIGGDTTYHLFDDVARRTESTIVSFYAVTQSAEAIIEAAMGDTYSMIILNVTEIITAKEEISNIISAIQNSVKTNFVLMAEGYRPDSGLVVEAARNGVSYFMLTNVAAERNRIFIDTLAGLKNVYDIINKNESEHQEEIEKQRRKARNARQSYNSISVAVAGCMQRIGCTSVSIQLVKFFMSQGKSACFLDFSETGYTELCSEYYGIDSEDYEHHRITIDGIDMYYRITAEVLSFIELQGYDFMVYDMGNILEKPQKQNDFLQKKYRLLVTGTKPNESKAFYQLLGNFYRTNISYLYNFVPTNEREGVIADVKTMNATCQFVPYMDDVFSLSAESIPIFHAVFAEALPPLPKEETLQPKKKRLFGKFKKGKEK